MNKILELRNRNLSNFKFYPVVKTPGGWVSTAQWVISLAEKCKYYNFKDLKLMLLLRSFANALCTAMPKFATIKSIKPDDFYSNYLYLYRHLENMVNFQKPRGKKDKELYIKIAKCFATREKTKCFFMVFGNTKKRATGTISIDYYNKTISFLEKVTINYWKLLQGVL